MSKSRTYTPVHHAHTHPAYTMHTHTHTHTHHAHTIHTHHAHTHAHTACHRVSERVRSMASFTSPFTTLFSATSQCAPNKNSTLINTTTASSELVSTILKRLNQMGWGYDLIASVTISTQQTVSVSPHSLNLATNIYPPPLVSQLVT